MDEAYTVQNLTPMRKVIAGRMTEAKQTIPHFRLSADVELDALLQLRRELRQQNESAELSVNDLLIKASAAALMDAPAMNIQWVAGEIRQFHNADVSVAIALADGLTTPIIRNAESKSVWEISREVRELTARAQRNALKITEILGGSFSISNLGMYGIDQFDAIINPPQCAILAAGRAKPCAVVTQDGQLSVATIMRVTLSIDHRAADGATGAKFLAALRRRLEHPEHLRPLHPVGATA